MNIECTACKEAAHMELHIPRHVSYEEDSNGMLVPVGDIDDLSIDPTDLVYYVRASKRFGEKRVTLACQACGHVRTLEPDDPMT